MNPSYLLQQVLQQSWQVALLAAVVWLLTHFAFRKRAHLSHMLWAMVLIKCITPPIWSSPVGFFSRVNGHWNVGSTSLLATNSNITNSQASDWRQATIRLDVESVQKSTSRAAFEKPMAANKFASIYAPSAIAALWIGGVCVMAILSMVRWLMFLNELRRTQCETPPEVLRCIDELHMRLGLRRKVGVIVVTSSLGPAVYGLLRPIVLLPKTIIAGRNAEQLKPLIAHEMIHIRRGDLWLALVQSIACNLGWFHPLVWLASRQLTIESERCCDEETIASLPCKPAAYARSLLEVLELKHQLRVAPALPGVRPVDITRSRLERIMRLGQGSRSRSPWWVWGVALLGGAVLLPGGKYVAAQTPVTKPSAKQHVEIVPMAPEAPNPLPVQRLTEEQEKALNGSEIIQLEIKVMEIEASRGDSRRFFEWMDKRKEGKEDDTPQASVAISGPESKAGEPNATNVTSLSEDELKQAQDSKQVFAQPVRLTTTFGVPILFRKIPYLHSLFKTQGVQQASLEQLMDSGRFRMESLTSDESKEYFETIVEPCQPSVLSCPRMMNVSGVTGTISVGQYLEPSKKELVGGFTLSATPTFVGENDVMLNVNYMVKKGAKQEQVDVVTHRDESAKDMAASTPTRIFETQARLHFDDTLVIASKQPGANEQYDLLMIKCSRYQRDASK